MACKISVVLLIYLTLISNASCTGRLQGTFGRDFFVGVLAPWQKISSGKVTLLITSANNTGNVNIHVPYLGLNTNRSFTGKYEFIIQNSIIPGINYTVEHMGIRVRTDIDVSLVVITSPNTDFEEAREAFLILPTSMVSNTYIIASYTSGSYWNSDFLILATESDTVVNITISNTSSLPLSVSMDYMDTYFYESRNDLSGTVVQSNKPIAVFSGHEATAVPHGCYENHFMAEQLLPTSMFGLEFIVPPLLPKLGYKVRVYGSEQNTTINYTVSSMSEIRQLWFPGQFHEISGEDNPIKIYSSKPVQVMLYSTCSSYHSAYRTGGSTMSIIPATQQYANTYFFTVSEIFGNIDHYLVIMANDMNIEDGLRINGKRMQEIVQSNKIPLYDRNYIVNIYKVDIGVYKLEHLHGLRFGALQYGFGRGNGKAYSNVLGLVAAADGLTCLTCRDMNITNMCYAVTKCSPGQVCFVETFQTDYRHLLYNMGCSDDKCTSLSRSRPEANHPNTMSKSVPICRHCCDHDICNTYCNVTNQIHPEVTIVG